MAAPPLDKKYLKEEDHEFTSNGNKMYTICGMRFETTPNYAVRKAVGQGAYGLVCRAQDTQSGDRVAIKKSKPRHSPATSRRPARPRLSACNWRGSIQAGDYDEAAVKAKLEAQISDTPAIMYSFTT